MLNRAPRFALLLVAAALAWPLACGTSQLGQAADAGVADAGHDAGNDAGSDAGGVDSGNEPDGGNAQDGGGDAGADAGVNDAGDAGSPDAGNPDAGDGGAQDAGAPDAGADAGPSAATMCAVQAMTQLYPGVLPTNPYAAQPAAGACAVPHDAIVLLGCPSNADGSNSTCQTKRADIAAALWQAGYAQELIVSGAAAHNQYVEADALAGLLINRGVSDAHIFRDTRAMHTDENIYYSDKIMEAHGWSSALIVSEDPGQLIETALCDSNCCVDLGRLTVFSFPAGGTSYVLGHYIRYPWTNQVSAGECQQIEQSTKLMCTQLASRLSCASNFQLPP